MRLEQLLTLAGACLIAAGCSSGGDTGSSGVDDPVVMVADDDAEMIAAAQEARDSVDQFIAALENPSSNQTAFFVKAGVEGNGDTEFFWLSDVSYNDGVFTGTIDNELQLVESLKYGDRHRVAADEINDWMILEGGEMVGGFTAKVLAKRQ